MQKMHKPGTSLRPKVDYTGSIGYNTSRSLAELITLIVGKTEHHVKNLKHLADDLKSVPLKKEEVLPSHDIVSLFMNTPVPETCPYSRRY